MRAFTGLIICMATSVVAEIPDIPISIRQLSHFGFQGYPWPAEFGVRSLAATIKLLSEEVASPLQTMLLIYQARNSGKIFRDIYAVDFIDLNEYAQYSEKGQCYQKDLDDKTMVCDALAESADGSILFYNLFKLCVDLETKITQFCADKMADESDEDSERSAPDSGRINHSSPGCIQTLAAEARAQKALAATNKRDRKLGLETCL